MDFNETFDLQHFCAVLFISKETELKIRNISSTQQKLHMQEIGLVDHESTK